MKQLYFLILILAVLSIVSPNFAEAGAGGHGGNPDVQAVVGEFKELGNRLNQEFKTHNFLGLNQDKLNAFDQAVKSAEVADGKPKDMFVHGKPVLAKNFYPTPRIEVNVNSWPKKTLRKRLGAVLHEYLGLINVELDKYTVSASALDEVAQISERLCNETTSTVIKEQIIAVEGTCKPFLAPAQEVNDALHLGFAYIRSDILFPATELTLTKHQEISEYPTFQCNPGQVQKSVVKNVNVKQPEFTTCDSFANTQVCEFSSNDISTSGDVADKVPDVNGLEYKVLQKRFQIGLSKRAKQGMAVIQQKCEAKLNQYSGIYAGAGLGARTCTVKAREVVGGHYYDVWVEDARGSSVIEKGNFWNTQSRMKQKCQDLQSQGQCKCVQ